MCRTHSSHGGANEVSPSLVPSMVLNLNRPVFHFFLASRARRHQGPPGNWDGVDLPGTMSLVRPPNLIRGGDPDEWDIPDGDAFLSAGVDIVCRFERHGGVRCMRGPDMPVVQAVLSPDDHFPKRPFASHRPDFRSSGGGTITQFSSPEAG